MLDAIPIFRRSLFSALCLSIYLYHYVYKSNFENAIIRNYKRRGKNIPGSEVFEELRKEGINITKAHFGDVFMSFSGIDREFSDDEIGELFDDLAEHNLVPLNNTRLQDIMRERTSLLYSGRSTILLSVLLLAFFWGDGWYEQHKRDVELDFQEQYLLLTRHNEFLEQRIDVALENEVAPLRAILESNHKEMQSIRKKYPNIGAGMGWCVENCTAESHTITFGKVNKHITYKVDLADTLGIGQDCAYKCIAKNHSDGQVVTYALKILRVHGNSLGQQDRRPPVPSRISGRLSGGRRNLLNPREQLREHLARLSKCITEIRTFRGARDVVQKSGADCQQVVHYKDIIVCTACTFVLMDLIPGVDGMDVIAGALRTKGLTVQDSKENQWKYLVSSDRGDNSGARTAVTKADAIVRIEIYFPAQISEAVLYVGLTTNEDDDSSFANGAGVVFSREGVHFTPHKEKHRKLLQTPGIPFRCELVGDHNNGIFLNFPDGSDTDGKWSHHKLADAPHYAYFAKIFLEASASSASFGFYVKTQAKIHNEFIRCLSHDLMVGLDHIHCERSSVHCDIKPDNVMIEGSLGNPNAVPMLKIIDFGNAQMAGVNQYTSLGAYSPPEAAWTMQAKPDLDGSFDMYSAGATLYSLASCLPIKQSFADGICQQPFARFIRDLCQEEPQARLTAAEALEHEYLIDLRPQVRKRLSSRAISGRPPDSPQL